MTSTTTTTPTTSSLFSISASKFLKMPSPTAKQSAHAIATYAQQEGDVVSWESLNSLWGALSLEPQLERASLASLREGADSNPATKPDDTNAAAAAENVSTPLAIALPKPMNLAKITVILQSLLKKQRPSAAQRQQREEALREISTVISKAFPRGEVHPFGSTACQTELQSSDTDVVVLANGIPSKMLMSGIQSECQAAFGARVNIKSIPFARVPVLKLAYRGVRFDVSFNQQAVLSSTRLLNSFQSQYGHLGDLVRLVKFWTRQRGFPESRHGGLSSWAWSLMTVYALQQQQQDGSEAPENALAESLLSFFQFYTQMNYGETIVSVSHPDSTRESGWVRERPSALIVPDPFDRRDVASCLSPARLYLVRAEFSRAHRLLHSGTQEVFACHPAKHGYVRRDRYYAFLLIPDINASNSPESERMWTVWTQRPRIAIGRVVDLVSERRRGGGNDRSSGNNSTRPSSQCRINAKGVTVLFEEVYLLNEESPVGSTYASGPSCTPIKGRCLPRDVLFELVYFDAVPGRGINPDSVTLKEQDYQCLKDIQEMVEAQWQQFEQSRTEESSAVGVLSEQSNESSLPILPSADAVSSSIPDSVDHRVNNAHQKSESSCVHPTADHLPFRTRSSTQRPALASQQRLSSSADEAVGSLSQRALSTAGARSLLDPSQLFSITAENYPPIGLENLSQQLQSHQHKQVYHHQLQHHRAYSDDPVHPGPMLPSKLYQESVPAPVPPSSQLPQSKVFPSYQQQQYSAATAPLFPPNSFAASALQQQHPIGSYPPLGLVSSFLHTQHSRPSLSQVSSSSSLSTYPEQQQQHAHVSSASFTKQPQHGSQALHYGSFADHQHYQHHQHQQPGYTSASKLHQPPDYHRQQQERLQQFHMQRRQQQRRQQQQQQQYHLYAY